jgi:hypothetical protein
VITTKRNAGTAEQSISIISRNGRITSLLGLPRLNGLTAQVLGVGGGFSTHVLDLSSPSGNVVAVAGGTGAGCFLSVTSSDKKLSLPPLSENVYPVRNRLLWSIRGDDFRLVEYVLENELLNPHAWSTEVFVTAGEEDDGLIAGNTVRFWDDKLQSMTRSTVKFHCRRMEEKDMFPDGEAKGDTVLFCGSKALEFQIKQWSLGRAKVYVTERT